MAAEMTLGEHVEELRRRVIHVAIAIIAITIFTMSFGLRPFDYAGIHLAYPFPDPIDNVSVSIMHYMQKTLLPEGVRLIQTAPGQAFFAQLNVAVLLGVLGSLPVITREISAFVAPAISSKTRLSIAKIMLPVMTLFTIGILFSYLVVIPFTLNFLYRYGEAIGVETFLNVQEFIGFVMQFFVGFGLAFQLPVIMYAISLAGVISPRFWRNNFRYAVIAFVIFGAAITPDGSGITMWFVALPMIALYLIGMAVVENRAKKERAEEKGPRDGIIA
ncbi:MAG TPA: twin-arginine translocase subunit TatC [Nitrososphaera sp.]|nr:twin-arginine translocase subunit TatC [Nitrososphaera sp.]